MYESFAGAKFLPIRTNDNSENLLFGISYSKNKKEFFGMRKDYLGVEHLFKLVNHNKEDKTTAFFRGEENDKNAFNYKIINSFGWR